MRISPSQSKSGLQALRKARFLCFVPGTHNSLTRFSSVELDNDFAAGSALALQRSVSVRKDTGVTTTLPGVPQKKRIMFDKL